MDMQWLASVETALGMVGWKMWAGAGAILVALIILIALMRAERTAANIVLAIVALFATGVGIAVAALGPGAIATAPRVATAESAATPSSPVLACLDGLAGDVVEAACERALFATPAMTAAAVSYVAGQLSRVETARGGAGNADLYVIRRVLSADRYGLVARVLATRNNCTADQCAAYALIGNSSNIARNMREDTYQGLVARHAPEWSGPALASAPSSPQADPGAGSAAPGSVIFPSAASIPPVSIMNSEPPAAAGSAAQPDANGGDRAGTDNGAARRTATPTPKPRRPATAQQQSAPAERRASRPAPAAAAPIQIAPGSDADADAQDGN